MFNDQVPSIQLSLPVCITTAEKDAQEKLCNKTVVMLKTEILEMLAFVTDDNMRLELVTEFKKASVKNHYVELYEKILEFFENDISENVSTGEIEAPEFVTMD